MGRVRLAVITRRPSRLIPPLLLALALLAAAPLAAETLRFSSPEGTTRFQTDLFQFALGALATFEFVLLLFLLGPATWRGVGRQVVRGGAPPGRAELLGLLALTVAGFLVRVLVAEPAAILSTFNDVKHAHDAMCLSGTAHACELTPAYPVTTAAIHALVFRVTGPSIEATYWVNAVLGALTIPVTWLLGTLLFSGRRAAGWLAACAIAGLPLHIRYSASGALTISFVLFATVAFAALLLFARSHRPRHLWVAGLALGLMIQSRYEAVAFGAPLLLATLVVAPQLWRAVVTPRVRWHAVAIGALVVATAALPLWNLAQPWETVGFTGESKLVPRLAFATLFPLAWLGLGRLLDFVPYRRLVGWAAGLGVVALLLWAAPLGDYLPASFLPSPGAWPVYGELGLDQPSFADRGIPLLNPRSVTLPAMALLFVGMAGGLDRERRGPVSVLLMWFGLATALGMQKFTGSIPFEHMRTAVDGVPAVAALAACGGLTLVDLAPRLLTGRLLVGVHALLAAFLLSGPLFSLPMLRAKGYDNQRQIAFLERTIPQLPQPAIVVFPNRTTPGQHPFAELFRIPEVWWTAGHTQAARKERFVGSDAALAAPDALLALREKGWTLLYWEGIECYRTRGEPGERRDDCEEMHWTFQLTPLAEEVIPNRPFESDFHEVYLVMGETVPLRVYRIDGVQGR